jgi:hypothetical protein
MIFYVLRRHTQRMNRNAVTIKGGRRRNVILFKYLMYVMYRIAESEVSWVEIQIPLVIIEVLNIVSSHVKLFEKFKVV